MQNIEHQQGCPTPVGPLQAVKIAHSKGDASGFSMKHVTNPVPSDSTGNLISSKGHAPGS